VEGDTKNQKCPRRRRLREAGDISHYRNIKDNGSLPSHSFYLHWCMNMTIPQDHSLCELNYILKKHSILRDFNLDEAKSCYIIYTPIIGAIKVKMRVLLAFRRIDLVANRLILEVKQKKSYLKRSLIS
jgi:hypothetical protein